MKIRFFLPSILWSGFMLLVFLTPIQQGNKLYFDWIPGRSFIHLFLFAILTYFSTQGLKKQWKRKTLRESAEYIALFYSIFWIIIGNASEISVSHNGINGWNLLFDAIGSLLGIAAFKLVYGRIE